MKHCLMIAFFLCYGFTAYAQQENSNTGNLALSIWIPDNMDSLTPAAQQYLHNKLSQIITVNGISENPLNSRFIITANVIMADKYIAAGSPSRQFYVLDVTLYIGDGFEGKVFSSYNTTVKGVGESETKAFISALKNIKTNNPEYQHFIAKGKARIVEYFNSQCNMIIKNAQTMAAMQQYSAALYILMGVPNVCTECWNKCMDVALPIFQQQIELDCKSLLMQANNVWNAGQSWDSAVQAGAYMSMINPNAACFNDALALANKIEKRIQAIDDREWKFIYDKEIELTKSMINAYRDVGVANAKNRPNVHVTYKTLW